MDLFIQYGVAASIQAIKDSGLQVDDHNAHRIGVAIGSGIGGLGLIEQNHRAFIDKGPRKISPFFVPSTIVNMIAGHVSINYGMRGPNISISTACTTGLHNIGHAARMIAFGDADAMVAGGAEKPRQSLVLVDLRPRKRYQRVTMIHKPLRALGTKIVTVLFLVMVPV